MRPKCNFHPMRGSDPFTGRKRTPFDVFQVTASAHASICTSSSKKELWDVTWNELSRLEPVRDLYCVLESDRAHKARTVIRSGDVNFDWDETFDLDLVVNRELDFLIYSWDPQLRHRLCFKGSLHLVPLLRESPLHQVALKVEPRGTLYLKLRYTEPRTAFRRVLVIINDNQSIINGSNPIKSNLTHNIIILWHNVMIWILDSKLQSRLWNIFLKY